METKSKARKKGEEETKLVREKIFCTLRNIANMTCKLFQI